MQRSSYGFGVRIRSLPRMNAPCIEFPLVEIISLHIPPLGSAQKLVHILFVKCPVFLGLLQIDYVKFFFNDPLIIGFCFPSHGS